MINKCLLQSSHLLLPSVPNLWIMNSTYIFRREIRLFQLTNISMPHIFCTFPHSSDGVVITQDPRVSVQEGAASGYDLLTGYTHDDAAGFVYLNFLGFPGLEDFLNLAATQVRKSQGIV